MERNQLVELVNKLSEASEKANQLLAEIAELEDYAMNILVRDDFADFTVSNEPYTSEKKKRTYKGRRQWTEKETRKVVEWMNTPEGIRPKPCDFARAIGRPRESVETKVKQLSGGVR